MRPVIPDDDPQQIGRIEDRLRRLEQGLLVAGTAIGAFSAHNAATISGIPTGGSSLIFDTEEYDYSGWYNPATGRYTPQIPGVYAFFVNISILTTPPTNGRFYAALYKTSGIYQSGQVLWAQATNDNSVLYAGMAEANGTTDFFLPVLNQNVAAGYQARAGSTFQGYFIGSKV